MPRTAAHSDAEFSFNESVERAHESTLPALDFSLPPFDHQTRTVLLIIGFSVAMTSLLLGIAFAVVFFGQSLLSLVS